MAELILLETRGVLSWVYNGRWAQPELGAVEHDPIKQQIKRPVFLSDGLLVVIYLVTSKWGSPQTGVSPLSQISEYSFFPSCSHCDVPSECTAG